MPAERHDLASTAAALGWPLHALCDVLCRRHVLRRCSRPVGRHGTRHYYLPADAQVVAGRFEVVPAGFHRAGEHVTYPRTYVTAAGLRWLRAELPPAASRSGDTTTTA